MITRQQRRANERRADKPEPGPIDRTSRRHMGRTKGTPFSRMKLVKVTPAEQGKPAVFHVRGYTSNKSHAIKATAQNIGWFVKGLTPSMQAAMLGRW